MADTQLTCTILKDLLVTGVNKSNIWCIWDVSKDIAFTIKPIR